MSSEHEKTIIAAYLQQEPRIPLNKLMREFDIDQFELYWILGKNNIERREHRGGYRHPTATHAKICKKGEVRIPRKILTDIGLAKEKLIGQFINFEIIDKDAKTVRLALVETKPKEKT